MATHNTLLPEQFPGTIYECRDHRLYLIEAEEVIGAEEVIEAQEEDIEPEVEEEEEDIIPLATVATEEETNNY
jgi:hypothetical protein